MLIIRQRGLRRALLTSSILTAAFGADAAFAQAASDIGAAAPSVTAPATPQLDDNCVNRDASGNCIKTKSDDIVVTGSRIRQDNYNTASPVQIITHDEITLAGSRSTAEILQGPSVTSGGAQINNSFLGFVTSGGPGANTVGLRGLGANRTLVLLNGRRLSPAGSESEVGSADLNTLPLVIVDHYEILKDGASTIYGSDAIAGVINVITKTKQDGFTFDGYGAMPLHQGDGASYRISGMYGKTFDRGHFELAIDYNVQNRLQRKDRSYARCPTDDLYDPTTGAFVGSTQNGQPRCLPFSYSGGQGTAQDYAVFYGGPNAQGFNRLTPDPTSPTGWRIVDDVDSRPGASKLQLNEDIYNPVKTLTGYANGALDIGKSGNVELYAEALFSHRKSSQTYTSQLSANFADGIYPGFFSNAATCQAAGKCPSYYNNPLFPKSLYNQGYYLANPLLILGNATSRQRVNYVRADAGIRGDVGIKNWHFDVNGMYARSMARYEIDQTLISHIKESSDLVAAPSGTPSGLTVTSGNDRVLPGTYTCRANVADDGSFISGSSCVPIDWFSPSVLAGNVPSNLHDWLSTPVVGHTTYTEITGEANLDGDLITLPAGALAFSIGATIRHDKLNDVPSIYSQNADVYNYSSASITRGSDLVWEAYGELGIPILKNKPFFEDLSAKVAGRYTHYRSYGSDTTYKVSGNWEPASFLRFRGSYGTSFRAPGLYEQNVAGQTGFFSSEADPCADYQHQTLPSSNRYKNCMTALSATAVGAANFNPSGGPEEISEGGKGLLKAETSTSLSYGAVIQPKFINLSFAVDYYRIKVKNEVTQLGTDILSFCYDSPDYATNFYCKLVQPRDTRNGNLTTFLNPYINVAHQSTSGLDFTARYVHNVGQGKVTLDVQATRVLTQKYQEEPGGTVYEYNGSLGNADFAGGPKWTGEAELRYDVKNWVLRYGLQYVGPMNSDKLDGVDPATDPYDLKTGSYYEHSASVQYNAENGLQVTFGVRNFTDAKPKIISVGASVPRLGNYFNYSGYDFLGRSIFMEVVKKF